MKPFCGALEFNGVTDDRGWRHGIDMDTQIDNLIKELGGPWPFQAVQALIEIGAPAVAALCAALENGDAKVRFDATYALVNIDAVPDGLLGAARNDEDAGSRALPASERIKHACGVRPLRVARCDPEKDRFDAVEVLVKMHRAHSAAPWGDTTREHPAGTCEPSAERSAESPSGAITDT